MPDTLARACLGFLDYAPVGLWWWALLHFWLVRPVRLFGADQPGATALRRCADALLPPVLGLAVAVLLAAAVPGWPYAAWEWVFGPVPHIASVHSPIYQRRVFSAGCAAGALVALALMFVVVLWAGDSLSQRLDAARKRRAGRARRRHQPPP
ncbi:MAG: hypothetical protein Q4G71_09305 [Pseudomonadota bacterium]|nr:hypothetical protein [Pseudomonadota bacterium]